MHHQIDTPSINSERAPVPLATVSRILGFLTFWALLILAICDSYATPISGFLDLPSLAIVFGGTFALLLTSFGWKDTKSAFVALFYGNAWTRRAHVSTPFFRLAIAFALGTGLIGMLVGIIQMLQAMDSPSQLGRGVALCFLAMLYAVILAALALAAAVTVARRSDTVADAAGLHDLSHRAAPLAGVSAGVSTVTVLACISLIAYLIAQ